MGSAIDVATSLFVLPPDTKLVAVPDLSARVRSAIGPVAPGQAVLTRPGFRVTSRLIPGPLASLITEFRTPSRLTDGVLRFARANDHDPFDTLELAFDALVGLVEARFLVPDTALELLAPAPGFGAGQAFAGFEIDRLIRSLNDSEVYRARARDGSLVALKISRDDRPDMAARLSTEVQVLERLHGTDTPALIDAGLEGDRAYFAMTWCEGVTIATAAQRLRATRDRRRLHQLVDRMFATYARLHGQGVLHGDIHPGNCLVTDSGQVVILDFGNARWIDAPGKVDPTRTGIPHFHDPHMAAALLAGKVPPAATPRSEQYALVALAYLLLTGTQRIAVPAVQDELLQRIVSRPVLPFVAQGVRAWPEVEAVLRRGLAHQAADRFPDLAALSRAFSAARVGPEAHVSWPEAAQSVRDAVIEGVRSLAPAANAFRNAWFALRAAVVLEDAELLAAARLLARPTGLGWDAHVLTALVAQAGADSRSEERAIQAFLGAVSDLEQDAGACNAILAAATILKGSLTRSPAATDLAAWASHQLDGLTDVALRRQTPSLPDPVLVHLQLSLCRAGAIAVPSDLRERLESIERTATAEPWMWALAHEVFADERFAVQARTATLPDEPLERGFALLRLYQVDGDVSCISRVRDLVPELAASTRTATDAALLMVELEAPEQAILPPFVAPIWPLEALPPGPIRSPRSQP